MELAAPTRTGEKPNAHHNVQLPDRVVIINDISVPRGGATSIALTSARALQERTIPVTFITGDAATELAHDDKKIPFEAIGGRHILKGSRVKAAARGIYNLDTARFISNWITKHDTPRTVYHLHGWSKSLSPAVFKSLAHVAGRLAIHAHDHFLACPNGGYFNFQTQTACDVRPLGASCLSCNCDRRSYSHKLWRSARQAMVKTLFDPKKVGRILPVHNGMVPLLERGGIPRERMRVLRNPVTPWHAQRVAAERNNTFLYVGRLDEDKGVHLLAQGARAADIKLRMIGTGPLEAQLKHEFPDIEFAGWKSRTQIADLCTDARAFVMPSQTRETFGLAIFEALLSGIPAIVSQHVMAAGEITEAGIGHSCDPANQDEFASLLKRISTDDETTEKMSKAAYSGAASLAPDEDTWVNELLEIYSNLLSEQAPGRTNPTSP